jgi:hypothetical protein
MVDVGSSVYAFSDDKHSSTSIRFQPSTLRDHCKRMKTSASTCSQGSSFQVIVFRILWLSIMIVYFNVVWLTPLSTPPPTSILTLSSRGDLLEEALRDSTRQNKNATVRTQSTTATSEKPQRRILRPLPSFENGGVVLFHHIAKTGGITIRKTFDRRHGILMKRGRTRIGMIKDVIPDIKEMLGSNNTKFIRSPKKILFVELHGYDIPGLMTWSSKINSWRKLAAANNRSFFMFSLLREPISAQVSYFNFFNVPPCNGTWCLEQYHNATESDFLGALHPNNQCRSFVRFPQYGPPPNQTECNAAYDWILQNMDWIGTMEEMNTVTLPLLSHMLLGSATKIGEIKMHNVQQEKPNRIRVSDLSDAALQVVKNATALDQELYERLPRDYVLEQPGFWISRPAPVMQHWPSSSVFWQAIQAEDGESKIQTLPHARRRRRRTRGKTSSGSTIRWNNSNP